MTSSNSDRGSVSSNRSLDDMVRGQDADPYLPGQDFDFMDLFDEVEDDFMSGILEEMEVDYDDLEDLGALDLVCLEEFFQMDEPNKDSEGEIFDNFNQYNIHDILPGKNLSRSLEIPPIIEGPFTLQERMTEGGVEVVLNGKRECITVGLSKMFTGTVIDIEPMDYYAIANTYAEEVGGKGVNLGFSSFYHSTVLMILGKNCIGVIEPEEGTDFATEGVLIEVTGAMWETRVSPAHWIINKYAVNEQICSSLPYHENYRSLSWAEDSCNFNMFSNTAFDVNETTRSKLVNKISELLPQITSLQRTRIGHNYRAWMSHKEISKPEDLKINRDFSNTYREVNQSINRGAKDKDGLLYVPSPFRVLYPQMEEDYLTVAEYNKRVGLQVFTTDYGTSTYHTWSVSRDPMPVLESKLEKYPEHADKTYTDMQSAIYNNMLCYKSVMHAHIQSNLLPKINGKGGCFYDEYNRVGISWYRDNQNRLTWRCLYYLFSPPGEEEEVGKWSYNSDKDIYISPTFLVSRQDIHYASVLPAKFQAMIASARTLSTPQQHSEVEPRLVALLGGMSNSTWMTSHRSGANRFVTCCHLSESGDIPSLISGQLRHDKYHRFPDFFILSCMRNYIEDDPPSIVTPFFRLPFRLMSLEKDFSQMTQWHIRDCSHATNCMVKLTEAAKRHALEEPYINQFMQEQVEFLEKMMAEGISSEEFEVFMDNVPEIPVFNVIAFIGMTNIVKEEIRMIGSTQHAMGFTIWKLITDRHCIDNMPDLPSGGPQIKTSRVIDAMGGFLRKFGKLNGAYEMLVRMMIGDKLPKDFLLDHEKDAKESDREISQTTPPYRIAKNFPESMVETFTGNCDADQMSDPMKYSTHVLETVEASRGGRGVNISEDRSKFCQEQEPQMQGLAIAIASIECGSTALRSAASLTMMNKTRHIIYPPTADHKLLLDGHPARDAMVVSGREKKLTKVIEIEKNMTQGLGAISAGLVNTIHVMAHDRLATDLIPGLEGVTCKTTSDDVKRSAKVTRGFSYPLVNANYCEMPNSTLHFSMMVNNKKKFMQSSNFSEFNNVVATKSGMVPQSPVHSTLCVQPLLSKSLFGDLVSMISSARSTLAWGCPPDTIDAALSGMYRTFRQKWLISESESRTLYRCGLIPKNMSEMLSGFWVRDSDTLKKIFASQDKETQEDIITGRVPLYNTLKSFELDILGERKKFKRKKRAKFEHIEGLHRANMVGDTVMSQRNTSENMMSRHIQPIHPKQRNSAKMRFFNFLNGPVPDIDITDLELLAPPRVTVHVRAARRADSLPTSLGTSGLIDGLSVQRIRASRYVGVNYRCAPTTEEDRIANLPEKEFLKELAIIERASHYTGLSFKAPGGRPLTRMFDNRVFRRPATFNFSVEMVQSQRIEQPFMCRGRIVSNFKPIIYGGNSMSSLQRIKYVLAFATGTMDGETILFYKRKGKGQIIEHHNIGLQINRDSNGLLSARKGQLTIYYRLKADVTPLQTRHHLSKDTPFLAGMLGDNDALFNYGFYCRSNSPSGFQIYQSMFMRHKSVVPDFLRKHMPKFPFHLPGSVELPRAEQTVLQGSLSAHYLKLIHVENPPKITVVDVTGRRPVELTETLFEEDVVDLDF